MAYQRKSKKALHSEVINVTDLDDEFEEFSLSTSTEHPVKRSVANNIRAEVNAKPSGHKHTVSNITSGKTEEKDPLCSKQYSDPLRTKRPDPVVLNSKQPLPNKEFETKDHPFTTSTTAKNNVSLSTQPKLEASYVNGSRTNVSRTAGQNEHTQQRNPVFGAYTTNSSLNRNRISKNQKGFGHEERDLFIDDIEEF